MKSKSLNYLIPKIESKSESIAHKTIKNWFYGTILKNNPHVIEASLEKYFETRRADIYFKFDTGQEIVVEIQNSPITSREITQRTKDYNNRGIYVLWVLYGDGKCVGSPKSPHHLKNLKVTPAEIRLHQLYRGRVYYVNIQYQEEEFKPTKPYALHFSFSDTFSPILFRKRFDSFFIRNVNYTFIPNWNLLCANYGNYRIARFYDRNAKNTLVELLKGFTLRNNIFCNNSLYKIKNTKKFYKLTCNVFEDEYGKNIIIDALLQLIKNKNYVLNKNYLEKIKKRLIKKSKGSYRKVGRIPY
ncbi:MAG: competence protein CoiA family protein [Candidatus Thorarchaeota archaeon]